MSKFERQWSDKEAADVIRRHLAGESNRTIGKAHGRAHTTVARLLATEDMQAVVREQRARDTEAARGRRRRASERAAAEGARPEVVETLKTGKAPRQRGAPKSSADGRLLGWGSFDGLTGGHFRYVAADGSTLGDATEEQWRELPREPFAPTLDARVMTGVGTYAFDPLNVLDIARVADIVASDVHAFSVNEIRATLSQLPQGRTIQFAEDGTE